MLALDVAERRRLLFEPCRTIEELKAWVYLFLKVDLPATIVDERSSNPSTIAPLTMLWKMYARLMYAESGELDPAEMLFYAAREAGKTVVVAMMEVLCLIHVLTDVVHLAAILEQAQDAQGYVKGFLERPDLRGLVVGDAKERTTVVYYRPRAGDGPCLYSREFKALPEEEREGYVQVSHWAVIVAASVRATNGKHCGFVCLDELDIVQDPRILGEARNIPSPIRHDDGTTVDPLTVYISTRKTAFGPVQRAIDEAKTTGLVVDHFNILEVTERCPESRHRPDLPRLRVYRSEETLRAVDEATYASFDPKTKGRYVADQAYTGCMTNCRIFASCKGQLATRPEVGLDSFLIKSLSHVVKKITGQAIAYVQSQLLCLRPSSTGLIYGHLLQRHHALSPAQAYERVFGVPPPEGERLTKAALIEALKTTDVPFGGGQDYGYGHDFAQISGFTFGATAFILRALAAPGLDPGQKLEYTEPIRTAYDPEIWADTEDPGATAYFRKYKWRMRDWVKLKGSVKTGIDIVKDKLQPPNEGEAEILFVFDVDEDDEMVAFWKKLKEHAWKLDAAERPTEIPQESGKDIADALRYWIMNRFPHRRGGMTVAGMDRAPPPAPSAPLDASVAQASPAMRAIVDELIGAAPGPVVAGTAGRRSGRLRFV